MGIEYRVNKQTIEKKSATKSPEEVKELLRREQYCMELLLVCEMRVGAAFLGRIQSFSGPD